MSVIQLSPWTGLTVVEFAEIFGMNLPHFLAVHRANLDPQAPEDPCDDFWFQEGWQGTGKASREDLAMAIYRAEEDMARELRYWPYPRWVEDEEQPWEEYQRPGYKSVYGIGARGRHKTVQAEFGHFIEGGRRVKLLVEAAPTVTIDTTAWLGTITFTLPAAGWTDCEFVAVVAGHSGDDEWWLRPLRFTNIGGGMGTLTGPLNAFVNPDEYLELRDVDAPLDGLNPAIYLATGDIELWRFYNDPSQPAILEWESSSISCTTTVPCCPVQQTACLTRHNKKSGQLIAQPATWTAATSSWASAAYTECVEPDRVRMWYRSGLPFRNCRVKNDWAQTIAILAACYIMKEICACESTFAQISYWQEFPTPDEPVSNYPPSLPFGPPKRGAIYAWERVANSRTAHATLI